MINVNIKNIILDKKTKDYTFIVLFLIIFSVFILFAINPSLKTAFSLKKEEKDLIKVDNTYEEKIINISNLQSQIENNREKLFLIDQAVSEYPEVNKIINDVKVVADKNYFFIKKANISEINLSKNKKNINNVRMIIEGRSNFDNLMNFISDLFEQRRLKMINNLSINKDKNSTESSNLNIILTIDSFYL